MTKPSCSQTQGRKWTLRTTPTETAVHSVQQHLAWSSNARPSARHWRAQKCLHDSNIVCRKELEVMA